MAFEIIRIDAHRDLNQSQQRILTTVEKVWIKQFRPTLYIHNRLVLTNLLQCLSSIPSETHAVYKNAIYHSDQPRSSTNTLLKHPSRGRQNHTSPSVSNCPPRIHCVFHILYRLTNFFRNIYFLAVYRFEATCLKIFDTPEFIFHGGNKMRNNCCLHRH